LTESKLGPIADAHAHIFPEKIAAKAVGAIGDFYHIPMTHSGLPQALLASGGAIGVRKYLVCSTATTPVQVGPINTFIAGECAAHPAFLGFATLHPGCEDLAGEVDRILELGLRGVKLHPDFQRFAIDAPEAMELYRLCEGAGLPILFHTGDARYDWSAPARLAAVARRFPGLRCIAAHFGGYDRWQDSPLCRGLKNVWFDTSSTLFRLPREEALALLALLGEDRFFFGTDFPMWDHARELERFLSLGLPPETRDRILGGNFAEFFGVAL